MRSDGVNGSGDLDVSASGASLRYVSYRAAVRFETMFLG